MAVNEPIRVAGPFVGDGVLVELDFDFETFAVSDVSVGVTNADDVETILTLDDNYTVTLNSGFSPAKGLSRRPPFLNPACAVV